MTTDSTEPRQPDPAAEPLALRSNDMLGLAEHLRKQWPEGVMQCRWCGGFSRPPCGCPADEEIERLRSLLARCRPIIEADAQMMADISRHAPLDADSQAKHDATEYESEKLARELERLLGPNTELSRARAPGRP